MRHTKLITRRPALAQSAYASKLLFKQELSTIVTQGMVGVNDYIITLGTGIFVNSLGLGSFIDFVIGGTDGGTVT